MAKKDNLPKTMENENESSSSITYANEVVAIIAGITANEVEGVASMCPVPGGILMRNNNKNLTKGVKIEVGAEEVSCELYVIMEYDRPLQKVAQELQENVRKAIESMTGLRVSRVDVHVQGVSFEKENNVLAAGTQKAAIPAAEEQPVVKGEIVEDEPEQVAEVEAVEEPAAEEPAEEEAEVAEAAEEAEAECEPCCECEQVEAAPEMEVEPVEIAVEAEEADEEEGQVLVQEEE